MTNPDDQDEEDLVGDNTEMDITERNSLTFREEEFHEGLPI